MDEGFIETFWASLPAEEDPTGRVHLRPFAFVCVRLRPFAFAGGRPLRKVLFVLYCTGPKSAVDQRCCGRKVWHTRHFGQLHRPKCDTFVVSVRSMSQNAIHLGW